MTSAGPSAGWSRGYYWRAASPSPADLMGQTVSVVTVGCGRNFVDSDELAARLIDVLAGSPLPAHTPRDRRRLLPITPVERAGTGVPGHGRRRHRLDRGPVAPLKLASGCDRRCTFCAIPRFRGAFVSRPPDEIVAEAAGSGIASSS